METAQGDAGRGRNLRRDGRGLVYVEFLIAFPPLFFLFLCTLQLGLLYAAQLGVTHSSALAARAAIVAFPDDPAHYEQAPKNLLLPATNCGESTVKKIFDTLEKIGIAKRSYEFRDPDCWGGPRVAFVRRAAIMGMIPFGPKISSVVPQLADVVPDGDLTWLAGSVFYNLAATAVTFPDGPESNTLLGPGSTVGGNVTVRVTHLYHCGIPMARFFMCDKFRSLALQRDLDARSRESDQHRSWALDRIQGSEQGVVELFGGTGHPNWLSLLLLSDEHFTVLRAETSLPLQDAPYLYRSQVQAQGGGSKGKNKGKGKKKSKKRKKRKK